MSHWIRVPIFSLPPVSNPGCRTLEKEIEFQESIGWEFVTLIPGKDHPVAEHREAPEALFRSSKR